MPEPRDALEHAIGRYAERGSGGVVPDGVEHLSEAVADLLAAGWRLESVVLGDVQHAHLTHPEVGDPVALGLPYILCGSDPHQFGSMTDHVGATFPTEMVNASTCEVCLEISAG